MINISKAAKERILSISARGNNNEDLLRIAVDGGGCAGYQYIINMTDKSKVLADDIVVEQDGLSLVAIDNLSVPFLQDCQLDFVENLAGGFFKIDNPNAKNGCGCGNSFELNTK